MKRSEYKAALQQEVNHQGLEAHIFNIYDDSSTHTCIEFAGAINRGLLDWLNNRFEYGVTLIGMRRVRVNFPVENNKEK